MEKRQLWDLNVGDFFSRPGEVRTYEYHGNGWYGRPYSGGPWHMESQRDFVVEYLPNSTLRGLVGPNSRSVATSKELSDRLLTAARLLWTLGYRAQGVFWFDHHLRIPVHMRKESIRAEMLLLWHELERCGVDVDQTPTFDWLTYRNIH